MSSEIPPLRREAAPAADLQILATEHWSLLATRSLTFNEALSRVTIFLAILSGALIALALVAQANHFGPIFISIAIPMLLLVMYSGIATVLRLTALNRDDFRWVIGMNRLRHAYFELRPDLERYFVTSPYDDLPGALRSLGIDIAAGRRVGSLYHLTQTLPGMLSVIVAAIAGAIVALAAFALDIPGIGVALSAAVAFLVALSLMGVLARRSVRGLPPSLEPRFPSPRQ